MFSSRLLKRTCKAAIWARKGGKEFCQGVILISDNSMYRPSGRRFTFHPGFTCFRLAMHNKCDQNNCKLIVKRTSDTFYMFSIYCVCTPHTTLHTVKLINLPNWPNKLTQAWQILSCRRCVLAKLHFKQITQSSKYIRAYSSAELCLTVQCTQGQAVWARKLCGASREPLRPDSPDSRLRKTFDTNCTAQL